jgi:hypothetical protein
MMSNILTTLFTRVFSTETTSQEVAQLPDDVVVQGLLASGKFHVLEQSR